MGTESALPAESAQGRWTEGVPRPFDSVYQYDALEYTEMMQEILRLLAVRSQEPARRAFQLLQLRILNRGNVEAFIAADIICVDISLLDLLWYFSFEEGVAQVKSDRYHLPEFTLAYAEALHTHGVLEQPDAYNTALTDEQYGQLWDEILRIQDGVFENALAFILAHEVGHFVLRHDEEARCAFPNSSDRQSSDMRWNGWRRRVELAADRFAARACLNALYQPAQIVRWFDLVNIRRSFYGSTAEYPTPEQRSEVVWQAYAERFAAGGSPTDGIPRVDPIPPIPPHLDSNVVDRPGMLKTIREIRRFRQQFLSGLDNELDRLRESGYDDVQAGLYFVFRATAYHKLIAGPDNRQELENAVALLNAIIDEGSAVSPEKATGLRASLQKAFYSAEALTLLEAELDREPADLEGLRELIAFARKESWVLSDAVELKYLLANTKFRWEPNVFESMLAHLPEPERANIKLPPYRLGALIWPTPPNFEERIAILKWRDRRYLRRQVELLENKTLDRLPGLLVAPLPSHARGA